MGKGDKSIPLDKIQLIVQDLLALPFNDPSYYDTFYRKVVQMPVSIMFCITDFKCKINKVE